MAPLTIHLPRSPRVLGYIAGLLDGEGTVALFNRNDVVGKKHPYVSIGNTNHRLILWLYKTMGGTVTSGWTGNTKHKRCYVWRLQGTLNVLAFLRVMQPMLRIKNTKEVIRFCEWKIAKVEELGGQVNE
ncbi:LAGLIDADG family homing endonuclease [Candidatus Woesearchaeota archaeon]|nr:LAGLIDADG family homing endonuclease [Candidatus Woesearchaeota archaeon]